MRRPPTADTHIEESPFAPRANKLFYMVFVPLGLALVLVAVLSLRWRSVHDVPIMMYLGFLMDRFGYVPYRDFFDFNMPGMHLMNWLIGRTVGYGDLGLRIFDLCYLGAILLTTGLYLKKIDWRAAWAGAILFGLAYLWFGPYMSLQREYLIILPLSLALLVACSAWRPRLWLKPALAGLLFGLAATIKLQAAIGFPLVLWFLWWDLKKDEDKPSGRTIGVRQTILAAAVGFGMPLVAITIYLWYHGALGSFIDMAANYWPKYAELAVNHQTIFGFNRVLYLLERYASLGGHGIWVMPAAVGFLVCLYHSGLTPARKRRVMLIGGMAFLYSIYPVASGQFWSYHWLLFYYFILVAGALCFVRQPVDTKGVRRFIPVLALLFVIVVRIASPHQFLLQKKFLDEVPKGGRVDEIAAFLQANLRPGDTVQPLDWTDGAAHAMLIAEARLVTRFVYAFSFYHHISSSYTKALRREFITALQREMPRYIIRMESSFPWVRGLDTTDDFTDLERFIAAYYAPRRRGNGYVIYELVTPWRP